MLGCNESMQGKQTLLLANSCFRRVMNAFLTLLILLSVKVSYTLYTIAEWDITKVRYNLKK